MKPRYACCLLLQLLWTLQITVPMVGQSPPPKSGYVPDEATAVRIAVAVFIPIYGARNVKKEGPFHARLVGDEWIVIGTLPKADGLIVAGGTLTAEIDRSTGRIKDVYHGK